MPGSPKSSGACQRAPCAGSVQQQDASNDQQPPARAHVGRPLPERSKASGKCLSDHRHIPTYPSRLLERDQPTARPTQRSRRRTYRLIDAAPPSPPSRAGGRHGPGSGRANRRLRRGQPLNRRVLEHAPLWHRVQVAVGFPPAGPIPTVAPTSVVKMSRPTVLPRLSEDVTLARNGIEP